MSESVTIALPTLSIIGQGSLVKLKLVGAMPAPSCVSARRGSIAKFSAKSRKRLVDLMASFDLKTALSAHPAIFITLTYGQTFPDCETAKRHLEAFKKRLVRYAPSCSALWRLEFQERGAPHFHFLVFNLPFLAKADLSRWWHEIVGDVYADNSVFPPRAPFTRIEAISSPKRAFSYVSKYIAKTAPSFSRPSVGASPIFERDAPQDLTADNVAVVGETRGFNNVPYLDGLQSSLQWTGRFWGIINRDLLPFAEAVEYVVKLTGAVLLSFFDFRRMMSKKWRGARSRSKFMQYAGATIYAWDSADQWLKAWAWCLGQAIGDDF